MFSYVVCSGTHRFGFEVPDCWIQGRGFQNRTRGKPACMSLGYNPAKPTLEKREEKVGGCSLRRERSDFTVLSLGTLTLARGEAWKSQKGLIIAKSGAAKL